MTSTGDLTDHILAALARHRSPYMLVGSFSSNAYGTPRSTQDMDIVMHIDADEVQVLLGELGDRFKLEPQIGFETKLFTTKHLIRIDDSPFMIEVFELSTDPHDQSRFERRTAIEVLGHQVWIASVEDVIIQKLRWARAKDLDDVRGILLVQNQSLDWDYLQRWCDQHQTSEKLSHLRASC